MLTATSSFTRKHYAFLGKLLLQKEPETAHKLITTYISAEQPTETDFTKIDSFFVKFCNLQNIEPEDHKGPLYKSDKVDTRRKFISAMVHLYYPQAFTQPIDSIDVVTGLVRNISIVLKQNQGNVSKMIRQAIIWEKQYEDFSLSVTNIIEKLTNGAER